MVHRKAVTHGPRRSQFADELVRITMELHHLKENDMSLGMILLIVLILMLLGAIPTWPHSKGWGYGPSGGLGLVLIILVVLLMTGRM